MLEPLPLLAVEPLELLVDEALPVEPVLELLPSLLAEDPLDVPIEEAVELAAAPESPDDPLELDAEFEFVAPPELAVVPVEPEVGAELPQATRRLASARTVGRMGFLGLKV
ncbi:MAG: hypothetical protein JST54_24795 [Deltaproteobacteria bacterium]|nr:hypothetical protein [Deltaproteobacteria bacterium]